MSKITLATTCYTIANGAIVEGTLTDFDGYIETSPRPQGVGKKFYATTFSRDIKRETGALDSDGEPITEFARVDVWALAYWATWAGPEVVVQEYATEEEADAAAEQTYVYDILNNSEISIYLDRASAEEDLADALAGDDA